MASPIEVKAWSLMNCLVSIVTDCGTLSKRRVGLGGAGYAVGDVADLAGAGVLVVDARRLFGRLGRRGRTAARGAASAVGRAAAPAGPAGSARCVHVTGGSAALRIAAQSRTLAAAPVDRGNQAGRE